MTKEELELIRKNEDRTLIMVINEVSKIFQEKIMQNSEIMFTKDQTSRKILKILSHKTALTQSDLVKATRTKGSTVSVAISKMENMGLVKRVENSQDMRSVRVYLTEKGYEQSKKTKEILDNEDKNIMRGIAPKDAKKAIEILEIILDNMVNE